MAPHTQPELIDFVEPEASRSFSMSVPMMGISGYGSGSVAIADALFHLSPSAPCSMYSRLARMRMEIGKYIPSRSESSQERPSSTWPSFRYSARFYLRGMPPQHSTQEQLPPEQKRSRSLRSISSLPITRAGP